jgi:hypothetical protein
MMLFMFFIILGSATISSLAIPLDSSRRGHENVRYSELDKDQKIHLSWTPQEDQITFEIQAAVAGWVGLGFSHTGGMVGADIVTCWVKDGKPYFQVRTSITYRAQPL